MVLQARCGMGLQLSCGRENAGVVGELSVIVRLDAQFRSGQCYQRFSPTHETLVHTVSCGQLYTRRLPRMTSNRNLVKTDTIVNFISSKIYILLIFPSFLNICPFPAL